VPLFYVARKWKRLPRRSAEQKQGGFAYGYNKLFVPNAFDSGVRNRVAIGEL
jgi:hypothetical protein